MLKMELMTVILVVVIFLVVLNILHVIYLKWKLKKQDNSVYSAQKQKIELDRSVLLLLQHSNFKIFIFDTIENKLLEFINGDYEECKQSIADIEKNIHPDDKEIYFKNYNDLINSDVSDAFSRTRIYDEKEGRYKYFEFIIKPLYRDSKGKITKYVITQKDDTQNNERILEQEKVISDYDVAMHKMDKLQKRFSLAMEVGNMSTWSYDCKEDKFFTVNGPSLTEAGVITKDELFSFINEDDRECCSKLLRAILNKEISRDNICFRCLINGEWRWINTSFISTINNGEIEYITGVRLDITEHINAQEKLKEINKIQEEANIKITKEYDNLNTILEGIHVPIYLKSIDDSIYPYINGEARKLFGGNMVDNPESLFTDDEAAKQERVNAEILLTGKQYMAKEIISLRDGRMLDTYVRKSIVEVAGQKLFLIVRVDNTELNAAQQAFKTLAASLPVLKAFTWAVDLRDGTIKYNYNLPFERNLNKIVTLEQFTDLIYEADRANFITEVTNFCNEGVGERTVAFRLDIEKIGVYEWWEARGVLVEHHTDDGSYMVIDGLTYNVNERQKMMENLRQAKEKAENSEKLKMAFLANMSHEIRTPLNAIVGFSDLMIYTEGQEERDTYGKVITANSEMLLNLINDILDLSKIETGFMDIDLTYIDVNQTFVEAYTTNSVKVREEVKLSYEFPKESLTILFDGKRLKQILNNFLSNAAKYTPTGEIFFSYEVKEGGIKVFVRDTGIGISEENKKKLFRRFEKFDDFAQGTGLGLSICKAIIDNIGGEIGVESELAVGSTFYAFIPCQFEQK